MEVNVGDYVQVVDRLATPPDRKSGLFYNHFRGLAGVVDRIYDDGAICVVVDHGTLTRDMVVRLKRAERVIKPRWKTAGEPPVETPEPAAETQEPSAAESQSPATPVQEEEEVSAAEMIAAQAAQADGPDDSGDTRANPGLRYSIVLKSEDVEKLKGPSARRDVAPARPGEEQYSAQEQQYMLELERKRRG